MHLTSLTLRGFKSFATSTTLTFEPGITAVVGPNGSGKSNVVDALAWVMGEQGAKSLRGGAMADVIFAGTAGRAPLGRAEVVVSIDNTDGALPIEYSEVTIARTLFRNGSSEYAINGAACRLLDVQELLSDSGIGREMHVIVGQGRLDSILQASPEERRGFIEEAAGVLKHRKRKERALRKLEATEANLTRLGDLTAELRRQLKPLSRQAEVARRASTIQAEARDARLRLLAADLVAMRVRLAAEVADETALRERQVRVEADQAAALAEQAHLEEELRTAAPGEALAQETWYRLTGLAERLAGVRALAIERLRILGEDAEDDARSSADPVLLEEQADAVRAQAAELATEVARAREGLSTVVAARAQAEAEHEAERARQVAVARAISDRREGLVRLTGQVTAARTRLEARAAEGARLAEHVSAARSRANEALAGFHALETDIAGLSDGERALDDAHERAAAAQQEAAARVRDLDGRAQQAARERAARSARAEVLEQAVAQIADGATALLSEHRDGVVDSLSRLLDVSPGWQTAIAAALGPAADALAVADLPSASAALSRLHDLDTGSATLLIAAAEAGSGPAASVAAVEPGAIAAGDVASGRAPVTVAVAALLADTVVVADLDTAAGVVARHPQVRAVTRRGDVVTARLVSGGVSRRQTVLEARAAADEAGRERDQAVAQVESLRFALAAARAEEEQAAVAVAAALADLNESDAAVAAIAERLGLLGAEARTARAQAERLEVALAENAAARADDERVLAELSDRLRLAEAEPEPVGLDAVLAEQQAGVVAAARQQEVDARLVVRTAEERHAALVQRAEDLARTAHNERLLREQSAQRRASRERARAVAAEVAEAVQVVAVRLTVSVEQAEAERVAAVRLREERQAALTAVRARVAEVSAEYDRLVDSVHRDEVARTEQRLRIEQAEARGIEEHGIDPEALVAEYGPQVPVSIIDAQTGESAGSRPFDQETEERRLRTAERELLALGRVNPLALEEFAALEERSRFLTEQVADLRRGRADLLEVVREVDHRLETVFAEAFADTARAFEEVFATLFPGGTGGLVLTDPENLLTTGVDLLARPAGKRVSRLSLLSGGERSLAAAAFLFALFKARPSPFYVLDEVEAALDDANLQRLLAVYEELRTTSQLIIISHQKRTMEIADALYGVAMRADGVSTVISQRLREDQPA
ncbi:MAG: chromosome segregation protein SMC [Actinomycetales bacterium]|nr:chromosome segregation protein SMC [Actinomycetales bacterium]